MFAAIDKNNKIKATGKSKNQIRKKLSVMGLNFSYTIVEIDETKESLCPVCGSSLKINQKGILLPTGQISCFFCKTGIQL